jgi:hypothetical protein
MLLALHFGDIMETDKISSISESKKEKKKKKKKRKNISSIELISFDEAPLGMFLMSTLNSGVE